MDVDPKLRAPADAGSPPDRAVAAPPRSQVRALVRDLAGLLTQQMFFWGCDAQCRGGNLLVRLGAQRLPREFPEGEGSSRYRSRWEGGTIELHSFCAGWYPDEEARCGIVFIRARERFFDCAGATPLTPGHYEPGRFRFADIDRMLLLCRPLLGWIADYEAQVDRTMGSEYRKLCWQLHRRQAHSRPWLPPVDAQCWLRRWLDSPERTPRAAAFVRQCAPCRTISLMARPGFSPG